MTKGRGSSRKVIPISQNVGRSAVVRYKGLGRVAPSKSYLVNIVKDDVELEYLSNIHDDMQFINKMRNLKENVIKAVGQSEYDNWIKLYVDIRSGAFDFEGYARRNNIHRSLWGRMHKLSTLDKFESVLRTKGYSPEIISDFNAMYHYDFGYHDLDGVERNKFDSVASLVYPAVEKHLDIALIDEEREEYSISRKRREELHEAFLSAYDRKYMFKDGYKKVDLDASAGTKKSEPTVEEEEFDATMYAGAIAGGGI